MSDYGSEDEGQKPGTKYIDRNAEESDDNNDIVDSSEEDEEDDDEEMQKIREGFIVDDEEGDEDEEESGMEGGRRSKKHRRHHRKRKRHHKEISEDNDDDTKGGKNNGREDDDLLDEDDLDLLRENTGAAPRSPESKKLKRLKKRGSGDADEGDAGSARYGNALDDIFSDDEQPQEDYDEDDVVEERTSSNRARGGHMDEMDDFIEEDSDEEGEPRDREPIKKYRPQVSSAAIAHYSDIDQEKLDQLFEIFGDGTDYEWALELEEQGDLDNEELDEDEQGDGAPKLTDIFEQTELKEKMLTEEDNQVRVTDIPERFQELRGPVKHYKLTAEDFEQEKTWVSEVLGTEKIDFLAKNPNVTEAFKDAVSDVLTFVCEDALEVPFIWAHRKDFITFTDKDPISGKLSLIDLLNENDLWRIVQLDIEFHSFLQKKKTVERFLSKLDLVDEYGDAVQSLTKLQEFQDFYEFLLFNYSAKLKELADKGEDDLDEIDEDDYDPGDVEGVTKKRTGQNKAKSIKRHSKYSAWNRIRNSGVYELVKALGITAAEVGANISTSTREHFTRDTEEDPDDLINEVATRPDSAYATPHVVSNMVEKMFAEELFHEPRIRSVVRTAFTQYARINVKLTEKGKVKITKGSPNYEFKYLINRAINSFEDDPSLFIRMLTAEQENLIQINIVLPSLDGFLEHIFRSALASDSESEISTKWNNIRKNSLHLMMKKLIPLVCLNIKEELRKECERVLFFKVRNAVVKKLDQAPYKPAGFLHGTVPETLTLSCGEGNFHTDAVVGVHTNAYGEVKEFIKFEQNPIRDPEFADVFIQKIEEMRPDVIGINGYNVNTKKLYDVIKQIIEKEQLRPETHPEGDYSEFENNEPPLLDVIFVPDEVARLYQNSQRAKDEFPDKSSLAKYCVALARYLQSPLLEYINLGSDCKAIFFHKQQYLLSDERLWEAITTAYVDIVNMVGVDINQAIREPYYAACLQYVAGLGPRKASGILQGIQTKSSSGLVNRSQLVTLQITAKNVFMNCSSFLRFYESSNSRYAEEADLLDETRIHPEDYVLATKMAADALELDEEDIEDLENRQGEGVIRKLEEGNNLMKLNELILEDYAIELETKHGKKKRATLYMIKDELQNHFEEIRHRFHIMNDQEIFTSLTGESSDSFYPGVVCTIVLKKVSNRFLSGVTQFLVNCNVRSEHMLEYNDRRNIDTVFHTQQAVKAKILEIDYASFRCEASVLKKDVDAPEDNRNQEKRIDEWDEIAEANDIKLEKLKLEQENKPKKFVKHPFFHNFNSRQAEEYLASMNRGDLVIRPSSIGADHLAITWKVDNNLYQHLDVIERTVVGRDQEEKKSYYIKKFKYSDLDELITFHIYKLAKNVELMVNHDKFYKKSRSEAENYLDSYIKANSGRGYYIFCFDHKHPGWFTLLFKGSEKSRIFSLPVEVTPNGYRLEGYDYSSVALLTNGFKQIMKNKYQERQRRYNGSGASGAGGGRYGDSRGSGYNSAPMYNNYAHGY